MGLASPLGNPGSVTHSILYGPFSLLSNVYLYNIWRGRFNWKSRPLLIILQDVYDELLDSKFVSNHYINLHLFMFIEVIQSNLSWLKQVESELLGTVCGWLIS